MALRQFRELFRLSQQHFQRVGARCGLSGAQLWAMAEVDARPGLKVSDLASALSVHLSTASNLLDRLQAKSLVRRERSEDDQRVVRVRLTKAGKRVLRTAPAPAAGVIPDALDHLPAETLACLSRELTILLHLTRVRDRYAALKPLSEP
jgi:DNA-binding MarR family transcriptional regulator